MTDGNLGDVVEVLGPLVCPTEYQFRLSAYFVVLPSVHKRGICRVSALLFLNPWLFDDLVAMGCDHVSLSSWNDYWGTVLLNFQRCKCCSDSVNRTLIGSKPDAALTHVQSLWYVLRARRTLNSRRGLSQFDQLHVAHLVDSATWFFTEDHIFFRQIDTNGWWAWSNSQLFQLDVVSFIFSSSCETASWDTPSTRRSISTCGFFSTAGSRSRTSLLVLFAKLTGSAEVLPRLTGSAELACEGWPEVPKLLAWVDWERGSFWRSLTKRGFSLIPVSGVGVVVDTILSIQKLYMS